MELTFELPVMLQDACRALRDFCHEDQIRLIFLENGLYIQELDQLKIGLAQVLVLGTWSMPFQDLPRYSVSLKALNHALELVPISENLKLALSQDHKKLNLMSKTTHCQLPLYLSKSEDFLETGDYGDVLARATVSSTDFRDTITYLERFNRTVEIQFTHDTLRFIYVDSDLGSSGSRDIESKSSVECSVNQSFQLACLKTFLGATPVSREVTLVMGRDNPLGIQYESPGAGNVQFFIAPRVPETTDTEEIEPKSAPKKRKAEKETATSVSKKRKAEKPRKRE